LRLILFYARLNIPTYIYTEKYENAFITQSEMNVSSSLNIKFIK